MTFDLNYIVSGAGQPFIFQHGLGANATQPQSLIGELPGWQAISMDCRGHGMSELPDGYDPSFSAYAGDVMRLMDHLEIDQAVFGGISMGAGISLHMATYHPDRVKGLILVRPAWLDKGMPPNLEELKDIVDYLDRPNGKEQFSQIPAFQKIQQELPNAANSILGMFNRDQQASTPRILTHMVNDAPIQDLSLLAQVSQPAVVIANEDDPLHPFEFGPIISDRLGNSELKTVISRYIHDAQHRQEVRQIIASFLSQFF